MYLHDFGNGRMYDAIAAVMEKFSLPYAEATKKIMDAKGEMSTVEIPTVKRKQVDIVEGVLEDHYDYWKKYHIPINIVKKFATVAKSVFIDETFNSRSTKANPIFAYKFPSGNIKLYRPLSLDRAKKWMGNSTAEDIGGWLHLPLRGKICIITSSIKDVMVLRQHGFHAIAFNGEGYGLKKDSETWKTVSSAVTILKKRFKYVFFFPDNDNSGIEFGMQFTAVHHVSYFVLSGKHKDISDYQKAKGIHSTFRTLKKLLSRSINRYERETTVPY